MEIGIDYIGVTTPFYCIDSAGNILLHKRSKKCRDEAGVWDAGGGKLEYGQTLEESVLREVAEEYGCNAQILEKMPSYTLLREHKGHKTHWVAVPFLLRINPLDVKINEPDKIDMLDFFPLSALPSPLHTGVVYVIKNYAHYFRKYALR